jgi:hypothetical protein
MLYSEIVAVCSAIQTKQVTTLRVHNAEFFNIIPGGTQSYHCALQVTYHQ